MKKMLVMAALFVGMTGITANAQTVKKKVSTDNYKAKVKPTTTVGDKIHNTFSKNKRSHGLKIKGKNKHTNAKTKVEVTTKPH